MLNDTRTILAALLATGVVSSTHAGVLEFDDFDAWTAQAGDFTTIGFDDFDEPTIITDQYAEQGAVFRSFSFTKFGPELYPQDDWGLDGSGPIDVRFDVPVTSIGLHHPGFTDFRLYFEDELILDTKNFYGGGGTDFFTGITLDRPFDRVEIVDLGGGEDVEIDNLYFTPIPAPGVLMPLALVAVVRGGRRRRG